MMKPKNSFYFQYLQCNFSFCREADWPEQCQPEKTEGEATEENLVRLGWALQRLLGEGRLYQVYWEAQAETHEIRALRLSNGAMRSTYSTDFWDSVNEPSFGFLIEFRFNWYDERLVSFPSGAVIYLFSSTSCALKKILVLISTRYFLFSQVYLITINISRVTTNLEI